MPALLRFARLALAALVTLALSGACGGGSGGSTAGGRTTPGPAPAAPATPPAPSAPPDWLVDAAQPRHVVSGFGAQIWPGDAAAEPVFRALGLRYARLSVGPDWSALTEQAPAGASAAQMDAFIARNFNADYPTRLASVLAAQGMLASLQARAILVQFGAPAYWLTTDGQRRLLPGRIADFARFWAGLVAYVDAVGLRPHAIELSNEPDGTWNTSIPIGDFATLLTLTRAELDARGLHDVGIVGPGLAYLDQLGAGPAYVAEIGRRGALSALAGFSAHAWDESFDPSAGTAFLRARWGGFAAAADALDPAFLKPRIVTEYASATTYLGGAWHGEVGRGGPTAASESPLFAVRVFQHTLDMLNGGAGALLYWQAADQPWDPAAWGLVRVGGAPRPVYAALETLMPHVPWDATLLEVSGGAPGDVSVAALAGGDRLVVAAANTGAQAASRRLAFGGFSRLTLLVAARFDGSATTDASLAFDSTRDADLVLDVPAQSTLTLVLRAAP